MRKEKVFKIRRDFYEWNSATESQKKDALISLQDLKLYQEKSSNIMR
jgi:hypothetical protein